MKTRCLALFVAASCTAHGFATNYVYVGGPYGNWNDPTNWSPAGIPGPGDNASSAAATVMVNVPTSVGGISAGGLWFVGSGQSLTVLNSPYLAANSSIIVNYLGSNVATSLVFPSGVQAAGSGSVQLNAPLANLDAATLHASAAAPVILQAAHVMGQGRIYAPLTVNSTNSWVLAFSSNTIDMVAPVTLTNGGTLLSQSGGHLHLHCDVTADATCGLFASPTSGMHLHGYSYTGGRIDSGGGAVTVDDGSAFVDSTLYGDYGVMSGAQLRLGNAPLAHFGEIVVNKDSGAAPTSLVFTETGTYRGRIKLGAPGSSGMEAQLISTGGTTVTLAPAPSLGGQAVYGSGRISGSVVNTADISASGSGNPVIELAGLILHNQGTITATTGNSTLLFTGITIQTATASIVANDGRINLAGSSTGGGTMSTTGTGTIQVTTLNNTIGNVNVNGVTNIESGAELTVAGSTFSHNGTITINQTSSAPIAALNFRESCTLSGSGEIVLQADPGDITSAAINISRNDSLNVNSDHALIGAGVLTGQVFYFFGPVSPSWPGSSSIGQIESAANLYFMNTSTLNVDIASGGVCDQVNAIANDIEISGRLNVSFTHHYVAAHGDSWIIMNGGLVTGGFSSINAPPLPDPLWKWGVQNTGTQVILRITCLGDYNNDGTTDFFDYLDFVDAFSANDMAADFNGDGAIDFFDYLDYVDAYSAVCP